ncbi:MAG TPA: TadE/TadG family type IV pilus assembly protein [Gemmataceae bacterium]
MRLHSSVGKGRARRRGVSVVEAAIVLPVVFLILLGIIVGALAVFAYQEVSSLAREGARYASVHGTRYEMATARPAATPEEIYEKAIKPRIVSLDPAKLTYEVTWDTDNRPGSYVTVKVSYLWDLGIIFGDLEFSSTSTILMSW